MVNGSGICGFMPGTHFQSSDSAFHRWTCASTMVRLACAVDALVASAVVAATVDATNWRRDSMSLLPMIDAAVRDDGAASGESARFASGRQCRRGARDGATRA